MSWDKLKVAAAIGSVLLNLLTFAGVATGAVTRVFATPARVDALESQGLQIKVLNTQMDWVVNIMSKKFGVEPPNLSEFQQGGQRAPR